jgi:hypothetical protein
MHLALLLLQDQPDPAQVARILATVLPLIGIFVVIGLAIVIVPFWFICKKAGFSPWLSLLVLIYPIGALILLYVLAFAEWKTLPPPQFNYPYPPPPPRG